MARGARGEPHLPPSLLLLPLRQTLLGIDARVQGERQSALLSVRGAAESGRGSGRRERGEEEQARIITTREWGSILTRVSCARGR